MSVDWQDCSGVLVWDIASGSDTTKSDGTSGVGVVGAHERGGVPPTECGQGGGLGMAERTWALEAVQCGGLSPHRECSEGGCSGECGPGTS